MTTERTEVPTPKRKEEIREALRNYPDHKLALGGMARELLAALDEAEKERDEAIAALRETLKTADEQRTELHRVENVARHKANADAYILAQAEKVIEAARKYIRNRNAHNFDNLFDALARWDEHKR